MKWLPRSEAGLQATVSSGTTMLSESWHKRNTAQGRWLQSPGVQSSQEKSCWDQAAGSAGSKLLVLKIQYISQMPSRETLLLRSHLRDQLKVLHLTSFSEVRP